MFVYSHIDKWSVLQEFAGGDAVLLIKCITISTLSFCSNLLQVDVDNKKVKQEKEIIILDQKIKLI